MGACYVAIWGDILAKRQKGFWSLAKRMPKVLFWVVALSAVMAVSLLACLFGFLSLRMELLFGGLVTLSFSAVAYMNLLGSFSSKSKETLGRYERFRKEAPGLALEFLSSARLPEGCVADVLVSVRDFRDEKAQRKREQRGFIRSLFAGVFIAGLFQGQLLAVANGDGELAVTLSGLCLFALGLFAFALTVQDFCDTLSKTSAWNADYLIGVLELYKIESSEAAESSVLS